jgi:glycerate dehydrogenase
MHRIVFLDRATVEAKFRAPRFAHEWRDYDRTRPEEVRPRLERATIAISNKVRLEREVLADLPDLAHIAVAATGIDNVDLAFCRERGIVVSNIRDYAVNAVPEHALMLMLALRRNLVAYREDVLDGAWSRSTTFCLFTHPISDLFGARLGILGWGVLGRATARLAEAFGMEVAIAERKGASIVRPGRKPFSAVLEESDVVSLHAPLNEETRRMIGANELAEMKPEAVLINTARGGLVDERALREALLAGRIAGLGFDVLEREPPPKDSILLEIAGLPNVIVTPHIGWASRGAMQALADQLVDNLEAFADGAPRNVVA